MSSLLGTDQTGNALFLRQSKMMFIINLLLFFFVSCSSGNSIVTRPSGCEYNSTTYPINTEWSSSDSCEICQCLSNEIILCRNRTCQIPKDCPTGEQLTIQKSACCPTCSPIRRSCLYDGAAILHNTIFYPKSCVQCRCRDGQLFCEEICREVVLQNKCSFHDQLYEINSIWSPISCVLCQCLEKATNQSVTSVCYIKQCPPIEHCHTSLQFVPGQCCPQCRSNLCHDDSGQIYQNGDVWTKANNCTHCMCRNGSIVCSEEICPNVQCKTNEKLIRLPNSCCPVCSHRSTCRFYGNHGYRIYYENDLWYTSACQYCTCRRHNRIQCKSIQCEYQFCLEHEIQEARSDSCCVSCRSAKQCHYDQHVLREGSYQQVDNCTLCTCSAQGQSECYSNCQQKGYSIIQLKTSTLRRNHTITVADSMATIIAHSKSSTILSTSSNRSILFQFSSSITTTKSNAAVLLGIQNNSTAETSYRLILLDFDRRRSSVINRTSSPYHQSDEVTVWTSLQPDIHHRIMKTKPSFNFLHDHRLNDRFVLIILIIILSIICFVLIVIIFFLCNQRHEKQLANETVVKVNPLSRPISSLSMVEKFQTPDLTTKVTLLTHFHLPDFDFGTDV